MANGFDDFLRGFSAEHPLKTVVSELDVRNKQKLELAMLSKRIEMEQKAKQVPLDQFQQTLGFLQGQVPATELQATSPAAQQAAFAGARPLLSAQARAGFRSQRPIFRTLNQGNRTSLVQIDPTTSQVTEIRSGLSSQATKAIAEAQANFETSRNLLDQIRGAASKTQLTQEDAGVLGRAANAIKLRFEDFVGTNPDASKLIRGIEAFSSLLTRAAGEKGVLTTQDVQRIIRSLPGPFDSAETTDALLNQFESLFEETRNGVVLAQAQGPEAIIEEAKKSRQRGKEKKPLSGINKKKSVSDMSTEELLKSL